jgi:hypothetical protein
VASAPVHLIDGATGAEHDVRFVAGMLGVVQDVATRALQPEFGWAVVYDEATQPDGGRRRRYRPMSIVGP